jgi:hypothetical protein
LNIKINITKFFVVLISILFLFNNTKCFSEEVTPSTNIQSELLSYLKSNWKSPEDYVIKKFADHDIVILGESHWIKHDPELIQILIPKLYKSGIYNLGVEWGNYDSQDKVDKLINANQYDENLARSITRDFLYTWGYKEYIDIYKAAWKLNKSLPPGSPKFRIVNLGYKPDWTGITEEEWNKKDKHIMNKVFYKGNADVYMASIVLKEIIARNQKSLIYCGMHHAFTRYRQTIYSWKDGKVSGYSDKRMGNVIHKILGNKVFLISLHYYWEDKTTEGKYNYPVSGVIDEIMRPLPDKRVGFDIVGSPFGNLSDSKAYYSAGHDNFKLSDFCDGYIFQKNFSDYESVTVIGDFINEDNIKEVLENVFPEYKNYKPADFIKLIREQILKKPPELK